MSKRKQPDSPDDLVLVLGGVSHTKLLIYPLNRFYSRIAEELRTAERDVDVVLVASTVDDGGEGDVPGGPGAPRATSSGKGAPSGASGSSANFQSTGGAPNWRGSRYCGATRSSRKTKRL